MKNNTANLDLVKNELTIFFNNETFKIDLSEGDYDDNWNSFTTKQGDIFDTNLFLYDSKEKFDLVIYEVENNKTVLEKDTTIEIVNVIGVIDTYLNSFESNKTFTVQFTSTIVVDNVNSLDEAIKKVNTMEVDFNDLNVTQII